VSAEAASLIALIPSQLEQFGKFWVKITTVRKYVSVDKGVKSHR
jgi:hypothetical protein